MRTVTRHNTPTTRAAVAFGLHEPLHYVALTNALHQLGACMILSAHAENAMPHSSPIHPSIRTRLEECFGCSLGNVRIHTERNAIASAKRLRAQAFTIGSDIYFGENWYRPSTREGLWLLAHELVHVLQQQRPDSSRHRAACWEQEADAAADLIASGSFLPRDFSMTPSPWGSVQCHQDTPCPGKRAELGNNRDFASQALIMGANQSIELAYKHDSENASHTDAIFVGTDFERGEIGPPKGAPNKKFATVLLKELRGLVKQRRPDIIDFVKRVIYEIKPVGRAASGTVQRDSYYIVGELIRREHGAFLEPPWDKGSARWYPSHILPLLGDPSGKRIVCTEATDHNRWPAMILYDVRELTDEEKKRKQMRQVVSVGVGDFSQNFREFWPSIRSELKRAIRAYDPESPEYVVIAPENLYQALARRRFDDMFRVHEPDFPGAHELMAEKRLLLKGASYVALVGAIAIVVGASVVLAMGATAVAAGAGVAAAGGAAGTGGGEVISLAAYRLAAAAPQAKALAAAAGVALILGTVNNARAANPKVDNFTAIRAVPLTDFKRVGGVSLAISHPKNPTFDSGVCSAGFSRDFAIGKRVLFDGGQYIVIGQLTAH